MKYFEYADTFANDARTYFVCVVMPRYAYPQNLSVDIPSF